MLCQDVTVTLPLEEMTRKEYQKIMKDLKAMSLSQPHTYTYDPELKVKNLTI